MKVRISTVALIFIFVSILFLAEVNLLFVIGLLVWMNIFVYSLRDTGNRSMLLAFMIVFFVFLMGREFVQQFFTYKIESFLPEINNHLYVCIVISLIGLFFGYVLSNYRQGYFNWKNRTIRQVAEVDPLVKNLSKYLFFVSWGFAVISKIVAAKFVSSYGYYDYYTDFYEYLSENSVLYLISKLEGIMPVALSIFSATLPSRKEYRIPSLMYLIYILISLATGQRSVFILGLLFFMIYYLYRNKTNPGEEWITKRMTVLAVISVPLLAVLMTILSNIRLGDKIATVSIVDSMLGFLYEQGVTGNVIKRAYMYKAQIPDQLYSLEFFHSGMIARIFNIPVFHGNTVDHALYGGSFTHALGYVVLGSSYLAGRGTGSSYVAELFHDFGYIGVLIGNIIYGIIIAHINRPVTQNNVFSMSVRFYIITQILWAPRASLTGFLSNLFAPLTILSFIFVFGLAKLMKGKHIGIS